MTTLEYLTTTAMTADATVLQCLTLEDGSIGVILDRTIFHVQGGGQPSDVGFIDEAPVLKVIRSDVGIVHLVDRRIAEGAAILKVDATKRQLHTRLHSAGHLIGAAIEKLGWHATKGTHQPGQCRVIGIKANDQAELPEKEAIQRWVNDWIEQGLSISVTDNDGLRTVTWGDLPAYPCGGTHVQNTRELIGVTIESVKFKKGELRVAYQLSDTNG